MDEPDEQFRRCSRKSSTGWRCSERAMNGRSWCKKHYLYNLLYIMKRKRHKIEENSESELVGPAADGVPENGGSNVVEEITCLFGEVQGKGVNAGCERMDNVYPGEGKQVQMGQVVGQILGDRVEFQAGYGEGGNQHAGLDRHGVADQPWSIERAGGNGVGIAEAGQEEHASGSGAGACENDTLDLPAVCEDENFGCLKVHESRGKRGRPKRSKKDRVLVVEDRKELLNAACNEEGGEALRLWFKRGQPKCSKKKNKQLIGLKNMNMNGKIVSRDKRADTDGMTYLKVFMSESSAIIDDKEKLLPVKIVASDEGAGKIARLENYCQPKELKNRKRGRPKGSKNKIKSTICTIDAGPGAGNIETPTKRGRPKGSKNKRKIALCVSNAGSGNIETPKKHGRPKASKNRMKSIVYTSNEGAGDIETLNEQGQQRGVKNKERSIVCASNAGAVDTETPKKRGRPKGSKNKMKSIVCARNEGASDIGTPKRRGRPKGSKNKKESIGCTSNAGARDIKTPKIEGVTFAALEDEGMANEMVLVNDGREKTVKAFGLENCGATHVSNGNQDISTKASGDDEVQNRNNHVKGKHNQPKGSKMEKSIASEGKGHLTRKTVGGSNEEMETIWLARPENGIITSEVEADKEFPGSRSVEYKSGNKFDKPRNKRGRPKSSGKKEKETVWSFDSETERHDNVPEIEGRRSAEASCRNDIDLQKDKDKKESLRNKKRAIKHSQLRGSRGNAPTIAALEDESEAVEVMYKSRRNERSSNKRRQSLQNEKRILIGRMVAYSKEPGNTKMKTKWLTYGSGSIQMRSGGRLRKLSNQRLESSGCSIQRKSSGRPRKLSNRRLDSSNLMVNSRRKKELRSLMCHQCWRNDRSGVVICSNCRRKRYCYECITKWYPEKTREELEFACPFCRGNCNCRLCLKELGVLNQIQISICRSCFTCLRKFCLCSSISNKSRDQKWK